MAEKYDPSEVTNPRKTIARREQESSEDPKKGTDAGDMPGVNKDFFKPRDRTGDKAGLEKALKNRK